MWNGMDSSLIEFNKSIIAPDSTTSSDLLQQKNYYHDKHTIWKLLYGHCMYVNTNTNVSFCTIDIASPYRIHLVVVVTISSSKYRYVMLWRLV